MLRNKFKRTIAWLITLILAITTLTMISIIPVSAATVTFYPTEIGDVLYNPYMGWAPRANNTNHTQKHTMVYAPLTWKELEPTSRGTFDWAGFESRNNFSYWRSKGVKINIRFYMDQPTSAAHRDIPDWLYNGMGANKGIAYNASIGQGFSPNYSDSYLISEHSRVIAALGARYNSDSSIAFIQLGSLGHWGEWHCWPYASADGGPTGTFPVLSVSNQYVQHYLNSFSTDKLTMRRGYQMAKDNGFGLFNDMFGDTASLDSSGWGWLWQINNGYSDDIGQAQPSMPDFWKNGPSGGEFANGNAPAYVTNSTINESVRQAQTSHTSWLGPCSPADMTVGCPEQANLDRLMKTMGYRFVLTSVSHSDTVSAGSNLAVTMNWNNKGVAPFYFNWPLRLALANSSGSIVTYTTTDEDIRNWLPGTRAITKNLTVPSTVATGTYKLLVAIIDPATNNPGVQLAISGKRADGWYELDNVAVGGGGSTPIITVDGNASDWSSISSISTNTGNAQSLKVYNNSSNFYVCVQGTNLNVKSSVFLNTDNNTSTGYKVTGWSSTGTGCEYLIENNTLYKYTGTGTDWLWSSQGTVTMSKNNTVIEFGMPMSTLSLSAGKVVKLGYILNDSAADRLPAANGSLPAYTCK